MGNADTLYHWKSQGALGAVFSLINDKFRMESMVRYRNLDGADADQGVVMERLIAKCRQDGKWDLTQKTTEDLYLLGGRLRERRYILKSGVCQDQARAAIAQFDYETRKMPPALPVNKHPIVF